jgi:hypothetical protein
MFKIIKAELVLTDVGIEELGVKFGSRTWLNLLSVQSAAAPGE